MKSLYTFIMDYLGGTYVSQIYAIDNLEAMRAWIANLQIDEIKGFLLEDQVNIIKENFDNESPILINGMKNVWCICISTKKGSGIIHFIKTAIN